MPQIAAIMLPSGATAATLLGWVAGGLQAALAVGSIGFSAKKILANTLLCCGYWR